MFRASDSPFDATFFFTNKNNILKQANFSFTEYD